MSTPHEQAGSTEYQSQIFVCPGGASPLQTQAPGTGIGYFERMKAQRRAEQRSDSHICIVFFYLFGVSFLPYSHHFKYIAIVSHTFSPGLHKVDLMGVAVLIQQIIEWYLRDAK